ncbi:MAG TPA: hypothetical protein VIW93_10110 [Candidatus Acidoferrum sp.]
MSRLEALPFAALLLACILLPAAAVSQEVPASQEIAAKTLTKKEAKKRQQQIAKELGSDDSDWLRNVVADIIPESERCAFLELSTNDERDQFIESHPYRNGRASRRPPISVPSRLPQSTPPSLYSLFALFAPSVFHNSFAIRGIRTLS